MRPNPLIELRCRGGCTLNGWTHLPDSWVTEVLYQFLTIAGNARLLAAASRQAIAAVKGSVV